MSQELDCFSCPHTIFVKDIFDSGKQFICPKCGKINVLDWGYASWGNPIAWFVDNEDKLRINNLDE